ncbi:MATE family efflux transporter [Vibrio porteresiae]|uniref:Multidrug resistance protein NorM n=1 Tax=Vibrio porteresiae DSM 19223 TaxID=1123496 RepID=A0ABZ0Q7V4_9VIBR|nr:MATE family efflux transporter [Vibrio porteresiae]WPC72521.1 MATE family efflux transporter [Vibrio porteresiae DSM 19223]
MHHYKKEAANLIKLAFPVLIASIAQTGMGFVDTIMAGGVSATDMASVSVAASLWFPIVLFGIGLLMSLVPVVAQLNGAGRQHKIPFEIQQGIIMALILSVPIIAIVLNMGIVVKAMGIEAVMAQKTIGYLHAIVFAAPAFLLFQALRSYTDGMALTKPAMVIGFIGLLCNIPLNWIFVYGKFGAPALGGVGCGVATAIVYWLMLFMLFFYVVTSKRLAHIALFDTFHKPQWKEQIKLFRLGFPVAAALFFEITLFALVSLLISPLGPLIVAAHQVAINFSALIFMLPMSIGAAVSIRVGNKLGSEDLRGATVASNVALMLAVSTAILTATATLLFKEQVSLLYTHNRAVIELAMQLLTLAAIYQCTDAVQVVASGALRGYKDMSAIFVRTFIAYWILGLPTGYILGLTDWVVPAMGAKGFWIGFIVGLSSAALMLGYRLYWIQKRGGAEKLGYGVAA